MGLRLAPWIHYKRHKDKTSKHSTYRELDCQQCVEMNNAKVRSSMHCGWQNSSQWIGPKRQPNPEWKLDDLPCCPGYLIVLPEVAEAERASFWAEKGMLKDRYDGLPLTSALLDSVEHLKASAYEAEDYAMLEARESHGA